MKAVFVYVLILTNPKDAGKVWGIFDNLAMAQGAQFFCPPAHPVPMLELPPYAEEAPTEPAEVSEEPLTVITPYDTARPDTFGFGEDPAKGCTVIRWQVNANKIEVSPTR